MINHSEIQVLRCHAFKDIVDALPESLAHYSYLFPSSMDARILLKPNLNSNMNALTGNTTDLRLLSALIQYLKERGYRNIVVGEGTNSGFYRNKIGVISRLKVDKLAEYYGITVKDFNYAEPCEIDLSGGVKAQVAKDCVEADLLINLPKVKTHFEVGMSVCLKNLMGCLVGQENKKKTHLNLAENILCLNQSIKPHLHIVDALVAMEGLGPTRGSPVRMDLILIGTDPYLLDLACARVAGFDYKGVKTLRLAEQKGLLTPDHQRYVDGLDVKDITKPFQPPRPGPIAAFIHSPKRQRFFLKIRNTAVFNYLCSTDWFGRLLFLSGLRQDVFQQDELICESLSLEDEACDHCTLCGDMCPLGLNLPDALGDSDGRCIHCLYCYCACDKEAIEFHGELGFFSEQLRQYDERMRKLYSEREPM
jgi:uncharacterized protein (DUF362 family)